jgi:hypothetical protein
VEASASHPAARRNCDGDCVWRRMEDWQRRRRRPCREENGRRQRLRRPGPRGGTPAATASPNTWEDWRRRRRRSRREEDGRLHHVPSVERAWASLGEDGSGQWLLLGAAWSAEAAISWGGIAAVIFGDNDGGDIFFCTFFFTQFVLLWERKWEVGWGEQMILDR